jgi:hypothetical protein
MHQYLVDHHLEEQRRDQREYLQEKRGDQHFREQMAVFVAGAGWPLDLQRILNAGGRAQLVDTSLVETLLQIKFSAQGAGLFALALNNVCCQRLWDFERARAQIRSLRDQQPN